MRRFAAVVCCLMAGPLVTPAEAGDFFKGRQLYAQHCSRCHGNDGKPVLPGTPNLSRGEGLLAPDQVLLRSLRFGKGSMPGFEALLRGKELYDVLIYVRSLHR
ncbi:MAG: cytochrome c [Hyphomicrobiaceae bacterium]|nr:cytochrome c [Hyphomicrobiaceae bacterium]